MNGSKSCGLLSRLIVRCAHPRPAAWETIRSAVPSAAWAIAASTDAESGCAAGDERASSLDLHEGGT
jgi:hypothetical protein